MASLLQVPVCEAAGALLKGKSRIKILEAGCGSDSQIQFPAAVYAVGIDISRDELEKNVSLQEKILGDIQDYPLPEGKFDAVVCWMVLEHLPRPKDALANLFRCVKPGGLLILGVPNLASIKGIATKLTPFWFHNLFYRLMRYKSRHFPTYLRMAILPGKMIRFAEASGFSVAFCRLAEGGVSKRLRARFRSAHVAFSTMDFIARTISLGKWQSLLLDECAMILKNDNSNPDGGLAGASREPRAAMVSASK